MDRQTDSQGQEYYNIHIIYLYIIYIYILCMPTVELQGDIECIVDKTKTHVMVSNVSPATKWLHFLSRGRWIEPSVQVQVTREEMVFLKL